MRSEVSQFDLEIKKRLVNEVGDAPYRLWQFSVIAVAIRAAKTVDHHVFVRFVT